MLDMGTYTESAVLVRNEDGRTAVLHVGQKQRVVYCPIHLLPYGVEVGAHLTLTYDGNQLLGAKRCTKEV